MNVDAWEDPERCQCDPCTLPRANGGRCPSFDTVIGNVISSHCLPCAHCCFEDDEELTSVIPPGLGAD